MVDPEASSDDEHNAFKKNKNGKNKNKEDK